MSDRVLDVKNLSIDIPLPRGCCTRLMALIFMSTRVKHCALSVSRLGNHLPRSPSWIYPKSYPALERLDLAGASILDYSEQQMSDIRGSKMGMIFKNQ